MNTETGITEHRPFTFPNPKTTVPSERRIQRALEILPGGLTWGVIVGMLLASWLFPIGAAVFVIVFDVYWIFLTLYVAFFSVVSFRGLRRGMRTDWQERMTRVHDTEAYLRDVSARYDALGHTLRTERRSFRERRAIRHERRELKRFAVELREISSRGAEIPDYRDIIHAVLLPTAGEGPEIIEPALRSIADSDFPNAQIVILLATEEREPEETRLPKVEYLRSKFDGVFRDFIVTTHEVATGEMKCKASNAAYAARKLRSYLDTNGIAHDRVVFSNFDCDSVVHPAYFSALTYAYITDPDRLRRAYQPIPMYDNNIWDTNAFVRVTMIGSSFWHMYQGTRKEMVTFSSHSEPFDTLVRVGFWPVNMISEDSIIFWKAFAYFHGDYQVRVIPLPISLDATLADTYWKTITNSYKQKRRWAYGIEGFPVTMRAIWPDRKAPLLRKLRVTFEMLEGHLSWAVAPLILSFLGWLPLFFGGETFSQTVLAHNLPAVTQTLMTISMGGLVVFVSLSFFMLPPRPERYGPFRSMLMFIQWAMAPLFALLGALPAIDAQTRLMLGKYFGEFWVTEKVRKN